MNIVVTGGAGFVGSHLCEKIIAGGDSIICVDNLFTGSKDNVARLLNNERFSFIVHDIVDPLYIEKHVDQIYNLACPASVPHYQINPVHTVKANTIGIINMLGLARKQGARILQTSTSEVYGDPDVHPQNEEYRGNVSITGPRACYDEGKRYAETIFFDYNRMHNMEIKVVRIFNTYGPRMAFDDGRVISNFIVQALKNEPLTVYGSGSQTRSFCYIDDLIEGLIKMMNSPKEITGPINLGNPGERTMLEIAKEIIALTKSKSLIKHVDLPVDDPRRRCPDITKAKKLLDWEPQIDFKAGLIKTIANFRGRLSL